MRLVVVFTNVPDDIHADKIAAALIEAGEAACVNKLASCTSVYRWKGKVEQSAEVPLLIKTTAQLYPAVERTIRKLHPYELPEIIAVPVVDGLPAYLDWVSNECFSPLTSQA